MKINWWLVVIVGLALVIRIYRLDALLGFYFDQGRDGKVIWDLWHGGRLFLIGPTTGIEGIFRGPWYYWLIAPAYLLGQGDPVWPAVWLALTSVGAIVWVYYLAKKLGGEKSGVIAALLAGFSFILLTSSRWLSNPTPMLLISMAWVQSIFWVLDDRRWGWLTLGASFGMAMQFGSAAEIFYLPTVVLLVVKKWRQLPWHWIIGGTAAFGAAFMPQVVFDLKHEGILRQAIYRFLVTESSFKASFWQTLQVRLPFYAEVILNKMYPQKGWWWWISGGVVG